MRVAGGLHRSPSTAVRVAGGLHRSPSTSGAGPQLGGTGRSKRLLTADRATGGGRALAALFVRSVLFGRLQLERFFQFGEPLLFRRVLFDLGLQRLVQLGEPLLFRGVLFDL